MVYKYCSADIICFRAFQKVIKDTFSLEGTPKEAMFLGLAGVVPYLVTSLQTVYLSYEINHAAQTGDGVILSGDTAELLLHLLEPVQVGYGAVVSGPVFLFVSCFFGRHI